MLLQTVALPNKAFKPIPVYCPLKLTLRHTYQQPKAYIGQSKRHDALGKMDKPPEFRWAISGTDDIRRLISDVEIIEEAGLSSVCKPRYPWLLRLVYATAWGRCKLDMRLMRIQVPSS